MGLISNEITLSNSPSDSISEISWSPVANHLAVSSWDQAVRIYDISHLPTGERKAVFEFPSPVLSCVWSCDGRNVLGGAADGSARLMDLGTGVDARQIAAHDAPVQCVKFVDLPPMNSPIALTGSWDRTVKYWDLRQELPIGTVRCQERVYAIDACQNLVVIGTAGRHVQIVRLSNPGQIYKSIQSPLKFQTRAVACIPDASGFAITSTEGRCGFHYVDKDKSRLVFLPCFVLILTGHIFFYPILSDLVLSNHIVFPCMGLFF